MNKDRRNRIAEIYDRLEAAKPKFEDLLNEVGDLQAEEAEAFDNLSEGLQASDQGQRTEAAAMELETAAGHLDQLVGYLDDVMSSLDAARE